MNNADLVAEVANQTSLTKNTSMKAVDRVISVVGTSLGREEKITLVGR
jgi:DNA-binding protein HU-beta